VLTTITEAIYVGWNALLSFLGHLEKHKELLALVVVTVGGGFALWRWKVDQKWRRVQHAQSLIKESLEKDTTIKTFEILDVSDEPIDFKTPNGTETILITDDFLIGALSTF